MLTNYLNLFWIINGVNLPKRQNEKYWIEDFVSTDFDFVFNHDVVSAMPAYTVVGKNQDIGPFHMKEFVVKK